FIFCVDDTGRSKGAAGGSGEIYGHEYPSFHVFPNGDRSPLWSYGLAEYGRPRVEGPAGTGRHIGGYNFLFFYFGIWHKVCRVSALLLVALLVPYAPFGCCGNVWGTIDESRYLRDAACVQFNFRSRRVYPHPAHGHRMRYDSDGSLRRHNQDQYKKAVFVFNCMSYRLYDRRDSYVQ